MKKRQENKINYNITRNVALFSFFFFFLFSFSNKVSAYTLFMGATATGTPDLMATTRIGELQLENTLIRYVNAPAGKFYYRGSFDPLCTTADWSWNGSYNGTSGGKTQYDATYVAYIDRTDIPSATYATNGIRGGYIDGHPHLYMCIVAILRDDNSQFWYLASSSPAITDLPTIDWHWNGVQYTAITASSTSNAVVISNLSNLTFDECGITRFDLGMCLADVVTGMFAPSDSQWQPIATKLHDDVLTHFPMGYLTDFVGIISASTTGSLPVIDATLPMLGNPHIHLDATHSLDFILNATTSSFNNVSASSTQTFYQITSYYWNIIVSILALLYIISRIIGSKLTPNGFGESGSLSDTSSKDDSYRLKEWLYKHKK